MNALAVSMFLALNIGIPSIPLTLAVLDDPLQSLDDVNLLGVSDLMRRLKDRRQLFVSTHDARFSNLLQRKLRPTRRGERTRLIELEGWSRSGPSVVQSDVAADERPVRIVA
jgi:wobble nucleotide-excising tRNase